jgi:hypothetical protein
LDERGLCERNQISRTIKKVLKDKIQEGKVTEKWIEECLGPEYKRQYTKSEVSSLSKQKPKQQIIEVSTEGKQVSSEQQDDDKVIDPSTEVQPSSKSASANKLQQDGEKSYKQTGQECSSCLELQDKVNQLSESLQRISIPTADQIPPSEFEIPILKENYEMVKGAMDKSNNAIFVKCDADKKFVRAVPDLDN